jgi:bifunctional non-homologous end joining protein LigD
LQKLAPLPTYLLPMLSTSAKPFDDPGCLFDVKWDGIRALASVERKHQRLWGREAVDYTDRYPELEILRQLPSGTMLDGELVALRDGQADFLALMERHSRRPS